MTQTPRPENDIAASRPRWLEARDLPAVIDRVRPHTMVPRPALVELARQRPA